MHAEILRKVCDEVYKKQPKFAGSTPKVSAQGADKYLLIFSVQDKLPGDKTLTSVLRVVADENGSIQKMSSSRG